MIKRLNLACMLVTIALWGPLTGMPDNITFFDDFEHGIGKWQLFEKTKIGIIDSKNSLHKNVLALNPGGEFVKALIKGSDEWTGYRIEAEFFFPDSSHSYMGLIYNYRTRDNRADFGSIYIKGNGSYIRVNPRRDHNAHRTLYEEYKTNLLDEDAIHIRKWHSFKAEIIDSVCHFYVGNMEVPKITFDALELTSGSVGFKPRVVGAPVWIDNVKVTAITKFSYDGPMRPSGIEYEPDKLVTDWKAIGPFCGTMPQIERLGFIKDTVYSENDREYKWKKFSTDKRGCIVSGKMTQFVGGQNIAYFYTSIYAESPKTVNLHVSSNEALAYWLNGDFLGYDDAARYAWYDFWKNPQHAGVSGPIRLEKGKNDLLIRVRGGKYAGGGFFVYLGN